MNLTHIAINNGRKYLLMADKLKHCSAKKVERVIGNKRVAVWYATYRGMVISSGERRFNDIPFFLSKDEAIISAQCAYN